MKRKRKRQKRGKWTTEKHDYSGRYPDPPTWNLISKEVRSRCPFCCYPECTKLATQVHHVIYLDEQNRPLTYIQLNDVDWLIGRILFSLCDYHHGRDNDDQVHHPDNWYSGELPPPTLDSFQYPAMHKMLMKGYEQKRPK